LPKARKRFGEDLDWYLIPISTLKTIGLIVLLAVLAGVAGYLAYTAINSDRARAQRMLKDGFALVEQIPNLPDFARRKEAYVQLQESLQNAQKAMGRGEFAGVQTIIADVMQRASGILSDAASGKERGVEEILDMEGKVQVQRKDQGIWEDARPRMPLYAGDFVKTGADGSVRIIASESSSTIILFGPKTLHEVAQDSTTVQGGAEPNVKMIYGTTDIFTQSQKIQVKTIQAQAEIDQYSQASFSVGKDREEIRWDQGSGKVTAGGRTLDLAALQKVQVAQGRASAVFPLLAPPKLMEPVNNKIVSFSPGMKLKLQWERTPGAALYQVQVSSSAFFVDYQEKKKAETSLAVTVTTPADYYWRVIALDGKGLAGSPSPPFKFRVVPPGLNPGRDKAPPSLTASAGSPLGSMCIIKGRTDPGAVVMVNGEEAFMDEDGSFQTNVTLKSVGYNRVVIKAVDPYGKETVKQMQVFVPDY